MWVQFHYNWRVLFVSLYIFPFGDCDAQEQALLLFLDNFSAGVIGDTSNGVCVISTGYVLLNAMHLVIFLMHLFC